MRCVRENIQGEKEKKKKKKKKKKRKKERKKETNWARKGNPSKVILTPPDNLLHLLSEAIAVLAPFFL